MGIEVIVGMLMLVGMVFCGVAAVLDSRHTKKCQKLKK